MKNHCFRSGIPSAAIILVLSASAAAQSQLVPLITDKTPLALSDKFGVVQSAEINHNGDFAFSSVGGSALFLRRAQENSAQRIFQVGAEAPGFPGSRTHVVQVVKLNSHGLVAFSVDFYLPSGHPQSAIFTYNGTLPFKRIASSEQTAPDSGGRKYERSLTLMGLNDNGDVAFTAPLVRFGTAQPSQTALFIAPAGASPIRIAGLNDDAAGITGGKYSGIFSAIRLNSRGEVLFSCNISGGTGGSGLFVGKIGAGNIGEVRKVVASGDPSPLGGVFQAPLRGLLNSNGAVAFHVSAGGVSAIWIASADGALTRAVYGGMSSPSPLTDGKFGNFQNTNLLAAFNDANQVAFTCQVTGSPVSYAGLFRYTGGGSESVETVAWAKQTTSWTPYYFAGSFTGISMNQQGAVCFKAMLWETETGGWDRRYGIYRQFPGGSLEVIAYDGKPAAGAGGGYYAFANSPAPVILDSGDVWMGADIAGGAADYGEFLVSGSTVRTLMSTADPLPSGSYVSLRSFRTGAVGDYIGFLAQRAGGGFSVGVHNITTQTTKLAWTDGEEAEPGYRIRIGTRNTVFVNASGTVAIQARVMGHNDYYESYQSLNVIGLRTWDGLIIGPAEAGDYDSAANMMFSDVSLPAVTPSPLTEDNRVAFRATLVPWDSTMQFTGIYVGSAAAPNNPQKVFVNTDPVPGGVGNFGNITDNLSSVSINQSGQVAFLANTNVSGTTRPGIYLWTPGQFPPAEIARVGNPGIPFSGFGFPSLNNNGKVAFAATLSGGPPKGGIYIGSSSASLSALALDGTDAGAGATYAIASARPDVVINDQEDVLFRSYLTGSSNSGIFLRRGPNGIVKSIVRQGQSAPGTNSTFATIDYGVNGLIAENFQLDPTGEIALSLPILYDDIGIHGLWRVKTADDSLEEMLVRGIVAPQFGGGYAATSTGSTAWNGGGRYSLWARVAGGSFADGIFLFVPQVATPTSAGSNVAVQPKDATTGTTPITLTFDNISQAGETRVTSSGAGPLTPSSFTLGDPPVFYDISTTAFFSGLITVCVDISNITFPSGQSPRLLHFENGAWVDVTYGILGTQVCGQVSSLSPFVVAQIPGMTFDVSVSPSVLWPANNKMVQITAQITAIQPGAPAPTVALVSITSNEPLQPGDIQLGPDYRAFKLRATRLGTGSGRTYAITYIATDYVGNAFTKTVYVVVPHDLGK